MSRFREFLSEPVRNGIYKPADFHGRGARIVNMGELFAYPRLKDIEMRRIEVDASELGRFRLEEGDLLFARRSLTAEGAGAVCYVECVKEHTVFESSLIRARFNKRAVEPLFAYYWFRSHVGRAKIRAILRQVAVSGITGSDLANLEFDPPPISVQRHIANLLGALDDKIDLNRRMVETLGAMARTLFRSWFVDFDSIHANAEGRPTGLPNDFEDQLPEKVLDDGLPEGWQIRPLPTLASFLNGLALQKYPVQDGEPSLPVIKIAELRTGPTSKSGRASTTVPTDYHVRDGDHLFSWSGSLMHCLWTYGSGALNQHLFKVSPLREIPAWLVYQAVEHHMPNFQAIAAGKAVTMGHIQRRHLDEATLAFPPTATLRAMDAIMSPLQSRGLALALQSRTLAALRDALLPRLITGELRIADAERAVSVA